MGALTLIRSIRPAVVCKSYRREADGTIRKAAVAHVTEGEGRAVPVPDAAAMAALLREVTEAPALVLCNGTFAGADDAPFRLVAEAELARITGTKIGEAPGGVVTVAEVRVAARLKRGIASAAWFLLDCDDPPGIPDDWRRMGIADRLAFLEPIMPGIGACERVELRSSSARVHRPGEVPGARSHAWVRVTHPDMVDTMRAAVRVAMVTRGLSFRSPRYSRKEPGTIIGHEPRTVVDLATWDRGRLVFCARPDVAPDTGLTVADAGVEVVNPGAGPFANDGFRIPGRTALARYADRTGRILRIRREAAGITTDEWGALTPETEIEARCEVRSLADWCRDKPVGWSMRCETPFRASVSEAAFLRVGPDGRPFLHDVGTATTYHLAREAGGAEPESAPGAEGDADTAAADRLAALRADVARAAALGEDAWALARKAMGALHGVTLARLDAMREERQREDAATERARRDEAAGPAPETDGRGRARLFLDGADLPDVAAELGGHLARASHLFVRGRPVRMVPDETTGALVAEPLTVEAVVVEAHRVTRPYREVRGKDGVEELNATLPDRVAKLYLADPAGWGLRPLAGIAAAPLLHEDGSLHAGEGYDARSRMWCRKVLPLDVPDAPSDAEALAALLTLRRHLRTFPFGDAPRVREGAVDVVDTREAPKADESAALAALLTAVCRPSLRLAPGILLRAPLYSGAGSGKGLLTRVMCGIAFGAEPSAMTAGADPAELDKRLTAALIGAAPVLFLDNLNATALQSDVLASAITESPAEVRRLGKSEVVRLNPSAFVAVTGNGVRLAEDMGRRFLTVELDARTEDPEARPFTGDIVEETRADRARLLTAALTVWRWGRHRGEALPEGKPMGSFGAWARWCRDPLLALGCADPALRIADAKAADPRRQMVRETFGAWWRAHGTDAVTVADLADAVKAVADPAGRGRQHLAAVIRNLDGTRAAGFVLNRSAAAGRWGAARYALAWTGTGAPPDRKEEGAGREAKAGDAAPGSAEPWRAEL